MNTQFGRLIALLVFVLYLPSCSLFGSKDAPELEQQGLSSARLIDDTQLEKDVKKNIINAALEFVDSQINVLSHNGWVLVTGQVQNEKMLNQVSLIAKNTKGVRQVHNHLTVGANRTMIARTNDGWIKLKVRNRLGNDKDFPAQKIIVHTE